MLVVDDDPRNLAAIQTALRELQLVTTSCGSGEEALRCLTQRPFAVILLDVNLPGLSGFETARLIRSNETTRHVPIIFITGHRNEQHHILRGYELGAVDYLFKPLVDTVLRAKVKVFVELHERTEEVARQAVRLREAERVAGVRRLQAERRRWEVEELRRQVRQQRSLNEQLSELDRRKDEFIALLAHELRNPLVPLVVGLRLIGSRTSSDPVIVDAHEKMARQVTHLRRLVDDLLDIARIREGKLQLDRAPIDLREVVDQAREMCRAEIERSGQILVIEGPSEPVIVDGDLVRMTQVVSNLLSNASRYSDDGCRIWLCWGTEGTHAVVRVRDEGHGISPEHLDRVFEIFAQDRREGVRATRGLGLGLAIVRELVEGHGGRVEVHSEGRGHGSQFAVWLPVSHVSAVVDRVRPRARTLTPAKACLRIVLVEDDDDIRELVGCLVEAWGHEVVGVAGTGGEAVRILVSQRPDVAVVDIGLPDFDGYTVARRTVEALGERRPGLVAMSGYGQEEDRRRAFEAGFDLHLVKPPEPIELRRALEQAFAQSMAQAGEARLPPCEA